MRDTMNFRRGILAMEWEHTKMKMQIADLEDHLNDIRAIKVNMLNSPYFLLHFIVFIRIFQNYFVYTHSDWHVGTLCEIF